MKTILIVDDHAIVRQGMKSMLTAAHPDWKIFEAENGIQAILAATKVKPDLILMDYLMPKLDGIKASSVITRDQPASRIIMVTMSDKEELLAGATEAGVKHLIAKDAPDNEILRVIHELTGENPGTGQKSEVHIHIIKHAKRKEKADKHSSSLGLTDRELEIVKLMMKGYPSKKISDYMGISRRTVEGHRLKIMKKCQVHSGQELMHFIIRNKILPVE